MPDVKEIKVMVTTTERGSAEYTSKRINGTLKSITMIPESESIISNFYVFTDRRINILDERNITKATCFYPGVQPSTEDGRKFAVSWTEHTINDMINFVIEGSKNKKVEIIIRWV